MVCLKCRKLMRNQNIYGLHKTCYKNWFDLSDVSKFNHLDPKKQDSAGRFPNEFQDD